MTLLRRASAWSQQNPITARLLIGFLTLLSVCFHYYWGIYLFAYDIVLPYSFAIVFLILSFIGAFLYPIKRTTSGIFAYSYPKQKTLDFFIFLIGGLLFIYLGNQKSAQVFAEAEILEITDLADISNSSDNVYFSISSGSKAEKEPSFTLSRKEMRKQIRIQIKAIKKLIKTEIKEIRKRRKKGEKRDVANILLTLLAILVALALGFLVTVLSCSLSCNGNEAAAAVVLILGWGGLLLLLFFVIRKIFTKGDKVNLKPKIKDDNYPYQ